VVHEWLWCVLRGECGFNFTGLQCPDQQVNFCGLLHTLFVFSIVHDGLPLGLKGGNVGVDAFLMQLSGHARNCDLNGGRMAAPQPWCRTVHEAAAVCHQKSLRTRSKCSFCRMFPQSRMSPVCIRLQVSCQQEEISTFGIEFLDSCGSHSGQTGYARLTGP